MNILMLNPPFKGRFSRSSRSPAVAKGGTIYYPVWLAYATGVLEQAGFNVRLVDAPAEGLEIKKILQTIRGFSPKLIVLDTSTASVYSDVQTANDLKANFPKAFIILVGTHVSALPEETLRLSRNIDAVARREYDYTLRDLAGVLQGRGPLSSVEGLSYWQGDSVIHNPDRPFIEELDSIPFVTTVYKKHLNIRNYFFAAAHHPMVMTFTGRGCRHRCTFCVYPQTFHGRGYRVRSPENVVEEFEWIKKQMPEVKEIGIEDDTLTTDRKRVRRISELILERDLRMKWYCNVRPDLDYETLRLMKRAGCRLVTTGFESGSQEMLDVMKKDLKLDRVRQFIENARKAKILVHGCIVIGNSGETRETIHQSITFAKELNCDSMQFYPLYVYPGTEAYQKASDDGCLTTTDYSQWVTDQGYHNCVLNLPGISAEEIFQVTDQAMKSYHLRPSYVWNKFLQGIAHPSEGWRSIKSAAAFMRSLWRNAFRKKTEMR
ncbi:B12-binding domain-containing radical SAM protein [Acidobacteriota bacterium]